jgi:N-acetylglucosamine-6-phosphate deacetylase
MNISKILPIDTKGIVMKTKLLVEQHFHGCYGVDFNKATSEDILDLSYKMRKEGFGAIFPTLVTDTIENIKKQIGVIKNAASKQTSEMARICGIHLEGIFLNPQKKGIHNQFQFLPPTIDNFKLIEDDFIKIVTLAPELAQKDLLEYLHKKGIKIQAGHCMGGDLTNCDGVTHIFNAMSGVTHKQEPSTALSALTDPNIYTEIIADGVHVNDKALKLLFISKPENKIILVSDCLPCTHSNIKQFMFADKPITFDGEKATSSDGTLAGSSKLLPDIIKILAKKNLMKPQYIENPYNYHKLNISGEIEWDENYNMINITK